MGFNNETGEFDARWTNQEYRRQAEEQRARAIAARVAHREVLALLAIEGDAAYAADKRRIMRAERLRLLSALQAMGSGKGTAADVYRQVREAARTRALWEA